MQFLDWLVTAAAGPALVALPLTGTAEAAAGAARRWFARLRRTDGLSRLVLAAADDGAPLSEAEFSAVRGLLEQTETWALAGRGTVEDLAALIAASLCGRVEGQALVAGRAIAAGVLEFAVHDREPELFRALLLARLDRLEADQASRLDQELLIVHADLAAGLAARDAADEDRFADLVGRLSRVLDRLPAGPAGPGEVAVYLARLARWLDADPWPRYLREGGPVLVPSQIERRLRVTGAEGGEERDADELSGRCSRLVILGESGAGKTWLARRTARRSALAALAALGDGSPLSEVELPLFTTCARLAAERSGDGIRDAIVRSAFDQLPDLGGSRVTAAVRELLANRNDPTLVVLDSLDEAPGADDRIRQAGTLPRNWRVILTSRPSSWHGQLAVGGGKDDPAEQIGTLRPLAYPRDVNQFIARWFAGRPEQGAGIRAQIKANPELQKAATAPLILAFYCIIGGDKPLSAGSADLHAMVINRMLAAPWRGSRTQAPNLSGCLETLRRWAWLAAASDPVSGVGVWADEFAAPPAWELEPGDRAALDHVAVPQGPPDPDTEQTTRRFAHRSIQEYLVARYVAALEVEDAAEALIGHLWYDPDWQGYAAPAAVALHPQRDRVLRSLVRRVTGGDEFPGSILALGGGAEIRVFLASLGVGTTEADWSPDAVALIGQARNDLGLGRWPASNDMLAETLLEKLEAEDSGWGVRDLVEVLAGMNLSAAGGARLRAAVFRALSQRSRWLDLDALPLAALAAGLAPDAAERAAARQRVIRALGTGSYSRHSLSGEREAELLTRLAATGEEKVQVVEELVRSLEHHDRLLALTADVIVRLDPADEQRRAACAILLDRLRSDDAALDPGDLGKAIARLRPTSGERAAAVDAMTLRVISGYDPYSLAETDAALTELTAPGPERTRARGILIEEIGRQAAARDTDRACRLTRLVAELELTGDELAHVSHSLLTATAAATSPEEVQDLAEAGLSLDLEPGQQETFRVRALEAALTQCGQWKPGQRGTLPRQFDSLAELAVTADERARALDAALGLLARNADDYAIVCVGQALGSLPGTAGDRERVRAVLLARLDRATEPVAVSTIAGLLSALVRDGDDREPARTALVGKLGRMTGASHSADSADVAVEIGELSATADEQVEARRIMLKAVQEVGTGHTERWLATNITRLRPVVADLEYLGEPPYGLGDRILAAMRENSPLDAWIAALPTLSEPKRAKRANGPRPGGPGR